MGSISGKDILDEFFQSWTAKVKEGKSPAAGLEAIRQEEPDLYNFYKIIIGKKGGTANV